MPTLNELKKTSGFFGGMIFLIVVIIVLGGFVIKAEIDNVLRVNKEVQGNQATLTAYEQKLKDLDRLKENYLSLEHDLPNFRKYTLGVLPDSRDEERLVVALRNISESSGVVLEDITFSSSLPGAEATELKVSLDVNAPTYLNLIAFFKLLEENSRIEKTTDLAVTSGGVLKTKISVIFYYQSLNTAGGR